MFGSYQLESHHRSGFVKTLLLEEERRKSQALLLNILPETVAERLKSGEEPIADSFDETTILFADIERFTELSERMSPEDTVVLLNQLFCQFDELAKKYDLEKIKTVGDAYVVAAGMPVPRAGHANAMADMALDMQDGMARFSKEMGFSLRLRIGIHLGPVVAGVIGKTKFAYDLWGDTVNTASRMESHGVAGEIQTTEKYQECLRDEYLFDERGTIEVKGKGPMRTYFLRGRRPEV
ncbi:MAG: hypothetical protein HN348_07485 [Proteobacteria bacterium]|nr:hypothetical protein [Pseudomonadota bacterium]